MYKIFAVANIKCLTETKQIKYKETNVDIDMDLDDACMYGMLEAWLVNSLSSNCRVAV